MSIDAMSELEASRWKVNSSNDYLVGGFNHLEKYQSMGRIIPYIMENKQIQTTNQLYIHVYTGYTHDIVMIYPNVGQTYVSLCKSSSLNPCSAMPRASKGCQGACALGFDAFSLWRCHKPISYKRFHRWPQFCS